ncbi:PREDICTED: chitin-binding lectin 1-like [Camelina sativa]|uniref:Chitin-binding lectin 1-like n=1 Tax=Camelina sativa TaxID=90675 RepID=A0ABM0XCJ5_CAMSA|nr:PREDICTED: chitin-binding lectin 1-like [Camelina sativa]
MDFFSLSLIFLLLVLCFNNPVLSLTDDQPLISSLKLHEKESCPYTVIVTTSCLSPDWSKDQITIALSDANGNQVVAPRLNEPLSGGRGGFEKCSSDTFQIKGECLNTICSVYIYRSGLDGWIPETVEIFKEGSKSVKFDFNENVPENIWSGNNNCNNTSLSPSSPYIPPLSPTVPPPSFPPEPPFIPPPPPRPSAAFGRRGGACLVVAFAAIAFAFAAVVV